MISRHKKQFLALILVFLTHFGCQSSKSDKNKILAIFALLESGAKVTTLSVTGLNEPESIVASSDGTLYVADSKNNQIKKITSESIVSIVADTNSGNGNTSPAEISNPEGITIDSQGTLYVSNTGVSSPSITGKNLLQIASGSSASNYAGSYGSSGSTNGALSTARFGKPEGIYFDSKTSILWVVDVTNNQIRKIQSGQVSLFAGSSAGTSGFSNTSGNILFNGPKGVATDSKGNVYVTDSGNHAIRKISSDGSTVITLAGSATGKSGFADGKGSSALFNNPYGITLDSDDNLYVVDGENQCIRKITTDGTVTTIAGIPGKEGSADGSSLSATFDDPRGITYHHGNLYVTTTDQNNNASLIRKVQLGN